MGPNGLCFNKPCRWHYTREPLLSDGIWESREEPRGQKKAQRAAEALRYSPGQGRTVTNTIWMLKLPAECLWGSNVFPRQLAPECRVVFLNEHLLPEVRGEALEPYLVYRQGILKAPSPSAEVGFLRKTVSCRGGEAVLPCTQAGRGLCMHSLKPLHFSGFQSWANGALLSQSQNTSSWQNERTRIYKLLTDFFFSWLQNNLHRGLSFQLSLSASNLNEYHLVIYCQVTFFGKCFPIKYLRLHLTLGLWERLCFL